ncbi:hypothetical protein [Streptomyces vilmorinianum]|uniref:hypothetical protein n=1 Tax=Streptomyces vilmorinianum TaxID=3051092 RepID=UPI003D819834
MPATTYRSDDLRALYVNCALKRSLEVSNTEGLIGRSRAVMEQQAWRSDPAIHVMAVRPRG